MGQLTRQGHFMTDILPKRKSIFHKILSAFIAFTFALNLVLPPAYAQLIPQTLLNLPAPGTMVSLTAGYAPLLIKGIAIHPENPLQFDFIIDPGQSGLSGEQLRSESTRLVKYFLASLTVPEDELWVNLSPYEKDRIVSNTLGQTEMGRDMLAQDYILKQLMASLMYPEKELGKKFWDGVYKKAQEKFGTTQIPMDTFNKVWIVPQKAVVYEHGNNALVVESRLKVMLESDYEAQKQLGQPTATNTPSLESSVQTEIVREIIIPALEKEVNEGQTFANLRQIYHSMILAAWYKRNLKESILSRVYVNRAKIKGVDVEDKEISQKIYGQYLEAFKKGVYNYIKEDVDPATKNVIPRKYFSGGEQFGKELFGSQSVLNEREVSSSVFGKQTKQTASARSFLGTIELIEADPEGKNEDHISAEEQRILAEYEKQLTQDAESEPVSSPLSVSNQQLSVELEYRKKRLEESLQRAWEQESLMIKKLENSTSDVEISTFEKLRDARRNEAKQLQEEIAEVNRQIAAPREEILNRLRSDMALIFDIDPVNIEETASLKDLGISSDRVLMIFAISDYLSGAVLSEEEEKGMVTVKDVIDVVIKKQSASASSSVIVGKIKQLELDIKLLEDRKKAALEEQESVAGREDRYSQRLYDSRISEMLELDVKIKELQKELNAKFAALMKAHWGEAISSPIAMNVAKRTQDFYIPAMKRLISKIEAQAPQFRSLVNQYLELKRIQKEQNVDKTADLKVIEDQINAFIDQSNVVERLAKAAEEGKLKPADIMTLSQFKQLANGKTYNEYLNKAKTLVSEGKYIPRFLFAGKATRLKRGEMYPLDLWKVLKDAGKVSEGSEFTFGMGPRQILAFRVFLTKLAKELQENPADILRKQKLIFTVNDDVEQQVLQDLVNQNFYGFNPENIYFLVQPVFKGYRLAQNGELVLEEDSEKLVYGHGDNAMQLAVAGEAYQITSSGQKRYLNDDFLSRMADGYIASHRVNDLTKFLSDTVVDVEKLAMEVYLQDQGYHTIVDVVANPARQKGGTPTNYGLVETLETKGNNVLSELMNRWGEAQVPYNAFRLLDRADTLRQLLTSNKIPYYLRFKDGYFYLDSVTGDLTQIENAKVAYVQREHDLIHDLKEAKNFDEAKLFIEKQDEELEAAGISPEGFLQDGKMKDNTDLSAITDQNQIKAIYKAIPKENQMILESDDFKAYLSGEKEFEAIVNGSPHRGNILAIFVASWFVAQFNLNDGVVLNNALKAAIDFYNEAAGKHDVRRVGFDKIRAVFNSLKKAKNEAGQFWDEEKVLPIFRQADELFYAAQKGLAISVSSPVASDLSEIDFINQFDEKQWIDHLTDIGTSKIKNMRTGTLLNLLAQSNNEDTLNRVAKASVVVMDAFDEERKFIPQDKKDELAANRNSWELVVLIRRAALKQMEAMKKAKTPVSSPVAAGAQLAAVNSISESFIKGIGEVLPLWTAKEREQLPQVKVTESGINVIKDSQNFSALLALGLELATASGYKLDVKFNPANKTEIIGLGVKVGPLTEKLDYGQRVKVYPEELVNLHMWILGKKISIETSINAEIVADLKNMIQKRQETIKSLAGELETLKIATDIKVIRILQNLPEILQKIDGWANSDDAGQLRAVNHVLITEIENPLADELNQYEFGPGGTGLNWGTVRESYEDNVSDLRSIREKIRDELPIDPSIVPIPSDSQEIGDFGASASPVIVEARESLIRIVNVLKIFVSTDKKASLIRRIKRAQSFDEIKSIISGIKEIARHKPSPEVAAAEIEFSSMLGQLSKAERLSKEIAEISDEKFKLHRGQTTLMPAISLWEIELKKALQSKNIYDIEEAQKSLDTHYETLNKLDKKLDQYVKAEAKLQLELSQIADKIKQGHTASSSVTAEELFIETDSEKIKNRIVQEPGNLEWEVWRLSRGNNLKFIDSQVKVENLALGYRGVWAPLSSVQGSYKMFAGNQEHGGAGFSARFGEDAWGAIEVTNKNGKMGITMSLAAGTQEERESIKKVFRQVFSLPDQVTSLAGTAAASPVNLGNVVSYDTLIKIVSNIENKLPQLQGDNESIREAQEFLVKVKARQQKGLAGDLEVTHSELALLSTETIARLSEDISIKIRGLKSDLENLEKYRTPQMRSLYGNKSDIEKRINELNGLLLTISLKVVDSAEKMVEEIVNIGNRDTRILGNPQQNQHKEKIRNNFNLGLDQLKRTGQLDIVVRSSQEGDSIVTTLNIRRGNGDYLYVERNTDKIVAGTFTTQSDSSGFKLAGELLESFSSSSPVTDLKDVGGIDLNPALLDLQIKRDGKGVPLPLPQQPMGDLMRIEGFIPVIINMVPATNLPLLLGMADEGESQTQDSDPTLKAREPEEVSLLN